MRKEVLLTLTLEELQAIIRNSVREELQLFKSGPPEAPDELINTRAACAMLKVSAPTLRRFVREGQVPCYRVRSVLRYKRAEVEAAAQQVRYLKHARKPL